MASKQLRRNYISGAFTLAFLALFGRGASAELLLFDDFEYVVNRDYSTLPGATGSAFVTQGPWSNVKAVNITGSHIGRLYTANAVPGYSGPMPGIDSTRVLKIESPNVSGGSDFYLQYGGTVDNAVPGNVWFQWWMYINHSATGPYGPELSGIENRHKFIYPTATTWPSNTNRWLISLSANPYNTLGDGTPFGSPTAGGQAYLVQRDNMTGNVNYSPAGDNASKLGPNLQSAANSYIVPNRWQLIKLHLDTSNSSSGKFEMWIKPLGGEWRKTAEWIGGVTPGFTWNGFTAGGHRGFRMPTTIGWSNTSGGAYYYVDDFAMASSEESLPNYDDPSSRPRSPTGVTAD